MNRPLPQDSEPRVPQLGTHITEGMSLDELSDHKESQSLTHEQQAQAERIRKIVSQVLKNLPDILEEHIGDVSTN